MRFLLSTAVLNVCQRLTGTYNANKGLASWMTQGYLTLATGDRQFYDAAVNVALSVRLNDSERPISLLCDDAGKLTDDEKACFDRVIVALPGTLGVGCAGKLDVPGFLPYEETVFLDSDCLIIKKDMGRHWELLSRQCFNVAGGIRTSGSWYTFEIADVCKALDLNHMVHMNSGVMYFRKGKELDQFLAVVQDLRENAQDVLFVQHRDMNAQIADEPVWGAAMGRLNMVPVEYKAEDGSLMVTTYMSRRIKYDPMTNFSEQEKSKGYLLLGRFLSKGWVKHSTSVAHFIRFKPRGVYRQCVTQLREWAGLGSSAI